MKFSTKRVKFVPLNSKKVLERVSEEDLFKYYLGEEVDLRRRFRSPLRDDKNPSCGFFTKGGGNFTLFFKDFSTGESLNCFNLVQKIYGISFTEALAKVNVDFKLGLGGGKVVASLRKEKKAATPPRLKTQIQVKINDGFSKRELEYWKEFGISEETLKFFNVYSVDSAWINKEFFRKSTEKEPMFGLFFTDTHNIKLYSPLSKKSIKWRSSVEVYDVYGMSQMKDCQEIYLTSSLKDVMALYEVGIPAIAMQSETPKLTHSLYGYLKNKKKIKVLYDNDAAGILLSTKLKENYPDLNLEIKLLPFKDAKDPSDHIKLYGKENLMKYVVGGTI